MFKFSRVATAARSPIPLAVRYDSLLVQCGIAALVYFVPQDAFIAGLAIISGRAYSNSYNKATSVESAPAALEKFYAKKGLDAEQFRVLGQSGNHWQVEFTNKYK